MSRTSTPAKLSIRPLDRVLTHWPLKLGLLFALTVGFCVPYVYLAHHAFFPVHTLPLLAIDRWAGFEPRWVWVYQSVYLLTGTLPWLATERWQLRRYVIGFVGIVVVCFPVYLLWPVRVPRPAVVDADGMYGLLLMYDGPYNAMPSLHAGFLYYTLAFTWRVCGRPRLWVVLLLATWSALILWSTLATKEHYALDLLAGLAIGAVWDAAAWHSRLATHGEKSHAGDR